MFDRKANFLDAVPVSNNLTMMIFYENMLMKPTRQAVFLLKILKGLFHAIYVIDNTRTLSYYENTKQSLTGSSSSSVLPVVAHSKKNVI